MDNSGDELKDSNVLLKEIWVVPNLLSLLRIFLLPIIWLSFSSNNENVWLTFVLVTISGFSDYFDGFFAKKLNIRTKIGQILDPLADKLTFATLSVLLYYYRDLPIWVPVFIILKDSGILAFGFIMAKKYQVLAASNEVGRKTTVILFVALGLYIIKVQPFAEYLLYIGLAGVIISIFFYTANYLRIVKDGQKT